MDKKTKDQITKAKTTIIPVNTLLFSEWIPSIILGTPYREYSDPESGIRVLVYIPDDFE